MALYGLQIKRQNSIGTICYVQSFVSPWESFAHILNLTLQAISYPYEKK